MNDEHGDTIGQGREPGREPREPGRPRKLAGRMWRRRGLRVTVLVLVGCVIAAAVVVPKLTASTSATATGSDTTPPNAGAGRNRCESTNGFWLAVGEPTFDTTANGREQHARVPVCNHGRHSVLIEKVDFPGPSWLNVPDAPGPVTHLAPGPRLALPITLHPGQHLEVDATGIPLQCPAAARHRSIAIHLRRPDGSRRVVRASEQHDGFIDPTKRRWCGNLAEPRPLVRAGPMRVSADVAHRDVVMKATVLNPNGVPVNIVATEPPHAGTRTVADPLRGRTLHPGETVTGTWRFRIKSCSKAYGDPWVPRLEEVYKKGAPGGPPPYPFLAMAQRQRAALTALCPHERGKPHPAGSNRPPPRNIQIVRRGPAPPFVVAGLGKNGASSISLFGLPGQPPATIRSVRAVGIIADSRVHLVRRRMVRPGQSVRVSLSHPLACPLRAHEGDLVAIDYTAGGRHPRAPLVTRVC
jgi:hypothetical protein